VKPKALNKRNGICHGAGSGPKGGLPQTHYLGDGNSLLVWDVTFILITVKILSLLFFPETLSHRMEKNAS
jgi:hypothetical protein